MTRPTDPSTVEDYASSVEHAAAIENVAVALLDIIDAVNGLDAAVDAASTVPLSVWCHRLDVARSTAQHWRGGRRPRLDHLLTIAASIDRGSADD